MTERVSFGIRNVHYALKNTDGTYQTPVPFPGAVSITNAAKGDLTEFYADDITYYTSLANQGYDGTFDFAYIHDDFLINVMGYRMDANGVLSEDSNARIREVALMFEFDTDQRAVRRLLPNVTFSRANFDSTTKTTSTDPNTSQLTYVASPGTNNTPQIKTTANTPQAVYDAWYTGVYGSTTQGAVPAIPTGLTVVATGTTATLTWNQVSGATSYNVYRDNGNAVPVTGATTLEDTGLSNNTQYSYQVSAVNSIGESIRTSAVIVTTSNS